MTVHVPRVNKVAAAVVGVVVLLALVLGSVLLVNSQNNHSASVKAAASASAAAKSADKANAAKLAQAKIDAAAKVKAAQVAAAKAAADAKVAAAKAAVPPAPAVVVVPVPAAGSGLTNSDAVVMQYYQDITNGDYADAWNLGGANIGGSDYAGWAAGYANTTSIYLNSYSDFGSDQVSVDLVSTQTDGSVSTYTGTYTVANGVIVAAQITQTG